MAGGRDADDDLVRTDGGGDGGAALPEREGRRPTKRRASGFTDVYTGADGRVTLWPLRYRYSAYFLPSAGAIHSEADRAAISAHEAVITSVYHEVGSARAGTKLSSSTGVSLFRHPHSLSRKREQRGTHYNCTL